MGLDKGFIEGDTSRVFESKGGDSDEEVQEVKIDMEFKGEQEDNGNMNNIALVRPEEGKDARLTTTSNKGTKVVRRAITQFKQLLANKNSGKKKKEYVDLTNVVIHS